MLISKGRNSLVCCKAGERGAGAVGGREDDAGIVRAYGDRRKGRTGGKAFDLWQQSAMKKRDR